MPEPRADAFIAPWISQVAALFTSGRLTPEEMAKPYMAQWPRLPPELLPFVQSLNLSTLAQVLKAHPMLYWHPLVSRQIAYLQRLRHDEAEWQRLGWKPQWDEEYGTERPPKEVRGVARQLAQLVEAHVSGMFPGRRIIWKAEPKQRGRKSGFSNPHPTGPWDEWLEADRLEQDFRQLHALFKARLDAAGQPCAGLEPTPSCGINGWPRQSWRSPTSRGVTSRYILRLKPQKIARQWWAGLLLEPPRLSYGNTYNGFLYRRLMHNGHPWTLATLLRACSFPAKGGALHAMVFRPTWHMRS